MAKGLTAVFLAGLVTVSAGCDLFGTRNNTPTPAPENRNMNQRVDPNVSYRRPMGAPMPAPRTVGNRSARDNRVTMDDRNAGSTDRTKIIRTCERINGVDDANVVVINATDTALIGIDLDKGTNSTRSKRIIGLCEAKAKALPGIDNAYATADPDVVTRIRKMAGGIADGKPLSSFRREINLIIRRIEP